MNKELLLAVVRALREAPNPERFSMRAYVHEKRLWDLDGKDLPEDWCGTPACALGHLGARTDLQDVLRIRNGMLVYKDPDTDGDLMPALYTDSQLTRAFDLDYEEMFDLFSEFGCDNAATATEAADYIEAFVKRKEIAKLCDDGVY